MSEQEKHLLENVETPPSVVVIQGPKGSGKTTLLRSLIRNYTNHTVNDISGTVTVRTKRNHRVTFIECPNDISAMIDLGKIADLALVMIDGSVGFEMETFEYLNILQTHGFPNVMGVMTHLDLFPDNKSLRKTKKAMKKRFETEVSSSAKLFHLAGFKNGLYSKLEVHNLARFISVMKVRDLTWRSKHAYILCDRFELISGERKYDDEDDAPCSFYGYLRGTDFNPNYRTYITGLGDYLVKKVTMVDDPCPIEVKDEETKKKKRSLKQKEKVIYAPNSNLGFINFDTAGGYITIPDKHVVFTRRDGEGDDEDDMDQTGTKLVRDLQDVELGIDERLQMQTESAELLEGVTFGDGDKSKKTKKFRTLDDTAGSTPDDSESSDDGDLEELEEDGEGNESDSEDEGDEGEDNAFKLSRNFKQKATSGHLFRETHVANLEALIYGEQHQVEEEIDALDSSLYKGSPAFGVDTYVKLIKNKFVTGTDGFADEREWGDAAYSGNESGDNEDEASSSEGEHSSNDEGDDETDNDDEKDKTKEGSQDKSKEVMKGSFNAKEEVEKIDLEYYRNDSSMFKKGAYVRVELDNIKYKHFKKMNSDFPLILCALNHHEDNFAYLKVRIKKHRWYEKILKSNDPLIFSIGWRRYQSLPTFLTEDPNDRMRLVKYTPKYTHCMAVFWGPVVPINTAFICTQTLDSDTVNFRICANGTTLETNHSYEILKKLKLVGEPYKIYKNSAFIKGMFNSSLEVAKFEGASIKTVSGIRGEIKKAAKAPIPGCYRATFEDKILKSDIIFCRTWYQVKLTKFYNPITSYSRMRLMKLTSEVRKQRGLSVPVKKDSEYTDIERKEKVFHRLVVPSKLQEALPFKSKQKLTQKQTLPNVVAKNKQKMVMSDNDKKVKSLLQRFATIQNQKTKMKKEKRKQDANKQRTMMMDVNKHGQAIGRGK